MNGKKVFSNIIWRFFERFGAQGVTLIVSIVLARLLDPQVYGTVAIVTALISILEVFIDSGLGNALIQKLHADDLDFSSVFYFNLAVCLILYAILFFCAPAIAAFYKIDELTALIRVLGLTLIISGVKNIQQAYVAKNMLFKRFFFATLGGTIGAAVVGILMALKGYGVWAVVAQHLFNATVDTIILWVTVQWRPKRMFSFERLKGLFSYGWKLLAAQLLDTVYAKIRSLIIGKKYSSEDLSYYDRGEQIPTFISSSINTAIVSVLHSAMALEQENPESVKKMIKRGNVVSTYILMPALIGIAACAETLVSVVLTGKWLPCVPYLRIFCICYAFFPFHLTNLSAIKAMGRSDIFLKLEILKKVFQTILILVSMQFGVIYMAYSLLIDEFLSQIVNSWPCKKLVGYGYLEQMKDMLPNILLTGFMFVAVYFLNRLSCNKILLLIIQVVTGAIIYVFSSFLLKTEGFRTAKNLIIQLLQKRKNATNIDS